MTRTRVRLVFIIVIAVAIYTAFIAFMVEGNNSGLGIFVMLGVSLVTAITFAMWGRPLMMIAAVVGILVYTLFVGAATNVVWGREEDPFGPNCDGIEWMNLIMDERCDGGPGPDGHDRYRRDRPPRPPECFVAIADAQTWEGLRGELLAYRDLGDVESVRTIESGDIDRGALDRGTGRDVLRIMELLNRHDHLLARIDVWRTDTGVLAAGMWVYCSD